MADPILPAAAAVMTPAIDAIVAAVPAALPHFNAGHRWADLPAIWRAQVLVLLSRLADEVGSARLATASGTALAELCASEFNTVLPSTPQSAVGTLNLARPQPYDANGNPTTPPAGIIPAGTPFVKLANPNAQPLPVAAASYVTVGAVYVPAGAFVATVQIVASAPGAAANAPFFPAYGNTLSITPAQPLFDATFATVSCFAAGGSSGLTDPILRQAAAANAVGQFGPTDGAIIAGLLSQQSVRHFAAFRAGALPYASLYIADESWSDAGAWDAQIAQTLASAWVGVGGRVRIGSVWNQQILVAPTLVLKSTDDLNDTTDIDASVRAAAESYFNDRPDWYRWRAVELRTLLSVCDSRILQCTAVSVTDAATGAAVAEPSGPFGQGPWSAQFALTHFYLTDQNVQASYLPPS